MLEDRKDQTLVVIVVMLVALIFINADLGTVETRELNDPTIEIMITGIDYQNQSSSKFVYFNITVIINGSIITVNKFQIQPSNFQLYGEQNFDVENNTNPEWTVGTHNLQLYAEYPLTIEENNFYLYIEGSFLRNGKTVGTVISYPLSV